MARGVVVIILAALQSPEAALERCRVGEMRRADAVRFAETINTREAEARRQSGA